MLLFVKESAVLPTRSPYTEMTFSLVEMQMSWGGAWQFFISIWPYYPASQGRRERVISYPGVQDTLAVLEWSYSGGRYHGF